MSERDRLHRQAERNRKSYPPGTRIELISMADSYAPIRAGAKGTVDHVDDIGTIHMKWDNGWAVALCPGEDKFRKIEELSPAEEKRIVDLGDECKIVLPDKPVDCSALGFFDDLEEDCWELAKQYCVALGVRMLPDEEGQIPVSYDIAKRIQDTILGQLQDSGVKLDFDGVNDEREENTPVMGR